MEHEHIGQDVQAIRPRSLSHVRGQKQVTELLTLNLNGYSQLNNRTVAAFGPVLLTGPSGMGKTMIARIIHAELGNLKWIETNGQTLNSKDELGLVLINADENTTLFVDEAQALCPKSQHTLLTALSERKFHALSRFEGVCGHSVRLAPFTMILATTHEHQLQEALRSRMRICCRFDYYSIEDLVEIVRQYADFLNWAYESDNILWTIARRAKGTPRLALHRNLQTCWYTAIGRERKIITQEDTDEAFRCLNIDCLGLDYLDQAYMKAILQYGDSALGVLASRLLTQPRTLQTVVEPYLFRENLIGKDNRSRRILTQKGKDHIEATLMEAEVTNV